MNAPVGPVHPHQMDWVWRQSPVETFNGRRGNVCLALPDIVWAGGAPIFSPVFLGAPSSQCSPAPDDDSTRLATTDWVRDLVEALAPSQGPPGPQGPPGVGVLLLGSVATAADLPATGNDVGDAYIALDTGILWVWDGSHWVSMTLVTGPQGATGPAGPQGTPGTNGQPGQPGQPGAPGAPGAPGTGFQVLGSVTDPAQLPPTGNHPGDVYIDESTGQGYVWDGTQWQPFNLGAQGPPGATGPAGAQGPPGTAGTNGTNGTPGSTGATGATGPPGPTGSQGPQGAQGPAGSGGVTSFNGRSGAISLSAADIANAGGLTNPNVALTGVPTAPTAPAGTNSTQLATTAFVTTNFVKIPGDTMTGSLTVTQKTGNAASRGGGLIVNATGAPAASVSMGSISADLFLNKTTGGNNMISGAMNGSLRWQMALGNTGAEGGGNSGSAFTIVNCSDSGAAIGTPFQISRPNGQITVQLALVVSSSRALKENILPLSSALARVKRLTGVGYNLKSDPDKKRQMGLIGQDVEPVAPEAVRYTNGEVGIQYSSLVALLIEAVKELAEKVERRTA